MKAKYSNVSDIKDMLEQFTKINGYIEEFILTVILEKDLYFDKKEANSIFFNYNGVRFMIFAPDEPYSDELEFVFLDHDFHALFQNSQLFWDVLYSLYFNEENNE